MREIKFRAWNGTLMLAGIPLVSGKIWSNPYGKNDYMQISSSEADYEDGSHWILMQYTGLVDKNGTEIYEGDILAQRPYGYFKSDGTKDQRIKQEWTNLQTVEWGEWQDFSGGYESEPGTFIGWSINPEDLKEAYPGDTSEKLEVIGNIYEKPES